MTSPTDEGALAPAVSDEKPEAADEAAQAGAAVDEEEDIVPSIFEQYETDQEAEETGKWFNNLRPGISMKLRRATSRFAMDTRRKVIARYRKLAKNGEFSQAIQEQILVHTMAEGIIVDWKGEAMRFPDGTPLPYNKKNAVLLLSKSRALREELTAVSTDMDNFRIEQRETISGN